MPKLMFIRQDGSTQTVDAVSGQSLMQVAVFNNVPGIVADCGGNTSCGTCHVYTGAAAGTLPKPATAERIMLDSIPHRRADSRLSCCIKITEELEGLCVSLPKSQYWG